MRIGELAHATGTPVRTIRYYEEIGLLPAAARTDSGYRIFNEDHRHRLGFIRASRLLGLTLGQMRAILEAADSDATPCRRVRETVVGNIQTIDRRIEDLRTLRSDLFAVLGHLENDPTSSGARVCPAIEGVSGTGNPISLDSPVDWRA